jgi:hypothetical protein
VDIALPTEGVFRNLVFVSQTSPIPKHARSRPILSRLRP